MKKLLNIIQKTLIVLSIAIGFAPLCQATGDVPELITFDSMQDLYESVIFEHLMHTEMVPCSSCHHHLMGEIAPDSPCTSCHKQSTEIQSVTCQECHQRTVMMSKKNAKSVNPTTLPYHIDIPHLKGALHMQCVGCHRIEGGPTGCRDCHAFTERGKKRFQQHVVPKQIVKQ